MYMYTKLQKNRRVKVG